MKKILSLLAGLLMLGAGNASAVTVSQTIFLNSNGTFDLDGLVASDGSIFNSSTDTLTKANVVFELGALGLGVTYSIALGDVDPFDSGAFTFVALPGFETAGGSLTGSQLADLNAGGDISYDVDFDSVFGVGGTISATLTAQVPDGGSSIALLGLGLCGVAGLKRRFARQ